MGGKEGGLIGWCPSFRMAPTSTIYIVDDDDSVRRSLARLMRSAGYAVEAFACVEKLLSIEHFQPRSCVVADVRMAGGSGLELPKRLRERNSLVPVIIVTADDREDMRGEARAAGVASFFRKPVDDQALIDAIEWAIHEQVGP